MKALVIYDSQFGNTEQVARAIGDALGAQMETTVLRATEVTDAALVGLDLLIVGSPTQSFHATKPVDEWLQGRSLRGVRAAAFDTRFDMAEVESRMLRLAVKVAGEGAYAAPRIAAQLEKDGAAVVVPPEGFIVQETEGPLRPGELERAAAWAAQILAAL
jgi:flavodoxin